MGRDTSELADEEDASGVRSGQTGKKQSEGGLAGCNTGRPESWVSQQRMGTAAAGRRRAGATVRRDAKAKAVSWLPKCWAAA